MVTRTFTSSTGTCRCGVKAHPSVGLQTASERHWRALAQDSQHTHEEALNKDLREQAVALLTQLFWQTGEPCEFKAKLRQCHNQNIQSAESSLPESHRYWSMTHYLHFQL